MNQDYLLFCYYIIIIIIFIIFKCTDSKNRFMGMLGSRELTLDQHDSGTAVEKHRAAAAAWECSFRCHLMVGTRHWPQACVCTLGPGGKHLKLQSALRILAVCPCCPQGSCIWQRCKCVCVSVCVGEGPVCLAGKVCIALSVHVSVYMCHFVIIMSPWPGRCSVLRVT